MGTQIFDFILFYFIFYLFFYFILFFIYIFIYLFIYLFVSKGNHCFDFSVAVFIALWRS